MIAAVVVAALAVLVLVAGWVAHVVAGGGRPRGLAPGFDVARTMSATAVRLRGRYTRPTVAISWWTPVTEVGIRLARAGRRWLYATVEDVLLVFGVPRTGKTGWLAGRVLDAPGACVVTSTRPDIHQLTVDDRRATAGPVEVFNPEDVGGIESTMRWDPVIGCDKPLEAIMRAGYLLLGGTSASGVSDRQFWEGQAHRALRCLLMAAALDGKDMHSVVRWASLEHDRPVQVLRAHPGVAPGWDEELRAILALDPKPRGSISTTLTLQGLQFMAVPALAHAATPPRSQSFDAASFLARRGTLYLIGAHREHAPVSPLFAALNGHIDETGKAIAARQPGGRLDPPVLRALDEAYKICRLPLALWTSDAGGFGMPVIIALQGPDQLYEVWGEHGGATIWTNAAIKLVFGGLQSGKHLDELSKLCGLRWHRRGDHLERVPVLEPGQIKDLADGEVLVLRRNTGPVIGRAPMVWEQRQPSRPAPAPERDWTGPLATVIRLADWRRRRDQRERNAS